MARRRKTKWAHHLRPQLDPHVSQEITGVILIALTLLLVLAIFEVGGFLVEAIFTGLRLVIGRAAYLMPLLLALLAVKLFIPSDQKAKELKVNNVLGALIFTLALAGLLHVGLENGAALQLARAGRAGGFAGYLISRAQLAIVNGVAASTILLAALFIGLMMALNLKLSDIFGKLRFWLRRGKAADIKINEPSSMVINSKLPIRGTIGAATPRVQEFEALTAGADPDWTSPSLDLLEEGSSKADAGNIKHNAEVIQQTLASFGIEVAMGEVNVGPTVTQYTLKPPSGVKLTKITALDRNLELSLAAHPIRVEAPIPGKSAVGVEVPNKIAALVRLRDILADESYKKLKSPLAFALGRDVAGNVATADLAHMPHLLIAGATGSGKSIMINSLLSSLLYRNSPADLKLILVDPKRVELSLYNGIPHLLSPVIVELEKCVSALKWTVAEMERRYKLFADVGKRNISEYNAAKKEEGMPFIVLVIDEMADLMAAAASDVEGLVVRLAQMARATGIHLVLATQRPSVNVITGLIKANIASRVAFNVASQVDSRTILDQAGAEKLLGKGDMLFMSPEFAKPRRIQGGFVSEKETRNVTEYLRKEREPQYNDEVLAQPVRLGGGRGLTDYDAPDDDMFEEAAEVVIRSGKGSASLLQRRLRVGYARAARLLDLLEERGIIGPADGARPRDVLVSSLAEVADEPEEE